MKTQSSSISFSLVQSQKRLIVFATLLAALTGCQNASWSHSYGNDGSTALGSKGDLDETRAAVRRMCQNAPRITEVHPLFFDKSTETCEWNQNGNLGTLNNHFQARREQKVPLNLPSDAIVCEMAFEFQPQPFYYDDEFLFTFNERVLTSSWNFDAHLRNTAGLLRYDWQNIVGRSWSTVTQQPYCAGADQGLSVCQFPATSTTGTISMSYDQSVIQEVFAQTAGRPTHEFVWTTTGDNDIAVDCRHEPIEARVRVSYVRAN